MGKGQKRLKNVPVFYDEVKRTHGIKLTDSTWSTLRNVATEQGISISELVERWGRTLVDTDKLI
jgi:hypothetical protein